MPAEAARFFEHEGFRLAFFDPLPDAAREPVLLIHGFASSATVNWASPGWIKALGDAGYRPLAIDNRGHGLSSKSYVEADYRPERMAADAGALLRHLGIASSHVMGYSMGARVAAFLAASEPHLVATLILGGLGVGLVEGVGEWDPIAAALITDQPEAIAEPRARLFRAFADQTKSDRTALAACIVGSRALFPAEDLARITQPTLIGVGTRDDIAGSADRLAGLMQNAEAFAIRDRDHMLAVGDRSWKARVITFLNNHPLDWG